MLKDIKHQKLFLNIQYSSLNETLIYTVSQSSTMNPQLLFSAIWTYIRSTEQQVLDSTYTVIRLLNKSLASWAYKQNLNALDLKVSLFRLFYCGINELIQGRKRSQNRMANWPYQLVSRHNLLIIQNSSFTTPPSKRKQQTKKQLSSSNDKANPGDPSLTMTIAKTCTIMDSWIGNIKEIWY